jgi:hypothetical protein
VHDAALAEVAAAAATLRFDTLSNSQFIENVRPSVLQRTRTLACFVARALTLVLSALLPLALV